MDNELRTLLGCIPIYNSLLLNKKFSWLTKRLSVKVFFNSNDYHLINNVNGSPVNKGSNINKIILTILAALFSASVVSAGNDYTAEVNKNVIVGMPVQDGLKAMASIGYQCPLEGEKYHCFIQKDSLLPSTCINSAYLSFDEKQLITKVIVKKEVCAGF